MPDNIQIRDAAGATRTVAAHSVDGVLRQRIEATVPTISATTYDESGNLTNWTQDGIAYVASYDESGNLLTQGPA